MRINHELGFGWSSLPLLAQIPIHSINRVAFRFHRMLVEFVWDAAAVLDGSFLNFVEVQTILDGATIVGKKIRDQALVANLADGSKYLLSIVKNGKYSLDKETFIKINNVVTYPSEEKDFGDSEDADKLNFLFTMGLQNIRYYGYHPFEKAIAFFLLSALHQFFLVGNAKTSLLMMNGILMSAGIDAISIPAARAREFHEKLTQFYLSRNGTEMMEFLASCHPSAQRERLSESFNAGPAGSP